MENRDYILWLSCLDKISLDKKRKLMEYYHKAENIFKAKKKELKHFGILSEEEIEILMNAQKEDNLLEIEQKMKKDKVFFCTIEEKEYPDCLRHIYDPPYGLFYKGKLPDIENINIAIVGARACSAYGQEQSYYFARILAEHGVQIISGLARGVDGFAHGGALYAKGRTFAVLGSGIDVIYPIEHQRIYQKIISEGGGILSEYTFGMPPYKWNFPVRNRIISGLSNGVLLIEARKKSGSLITADLALDQGKDVFALPGRASDPLSFGTNRLIKQGAELVTVPEDILEYYSLFGKEKNEKKHFLLEREEKIVYANLGLEEKHLNRLVQETNMGTGKLMEILLGLEAKGLVRQTGLYFHAILSDVQV